MIHLIAVCFDSWPITLKRKTFLKSLWENTYKTNTKAAEKWKIVNPSKIKAAEKVKGHGCTLLWFNNFRVELKSLVICVGGNQEPISYFIIVIKLFIVEAEPLRGIVMRINIFHTIPINNYLRMKKLGMIIKTVRKLVLLCWINNHTV